MIDTVTAPHGTTASGLPRRRPGAQLYGPATNHATGRGGAGASATDVAMLLNDLASREPEIRHAVVVSPDGLVLAATAQLPADSREQLAAVGSGVVSLLWGAATFFQAGRMVANVTEMDGGFMFAMSAASGSAVLALTSRGCDIARVRRELTELIEQLRPSLTTPPR